MPNINAIALTVLAGSALAASIPALEPTSALPSAGTPLAKGPAPLEPSQADSSGGISVTGEGTAPLAIDRVEVQISVSSSAKTTGDALQAFNAKKALLQKALEGFDGAALRGAGTRVGFKQSSNQAFVFDGNPPAEPKFEVSETVTVSLPDANVKTVVELIDEAQDVDCKLNGRGNDQMQAFYIAQSGGQASKASAIRYLASDEAQAAAAKKALELAFADAKAKADALAQVAGVMVGPATSLRVMTPFPTSSEMAKGADGSVRISVRFAILN